MKPLNQTARDLMAAARKLIDAVSYDVCGINGRGGNGGLTSTETIRASDELRMALSRCEKEYAAMKAAEDGV